MLMKCSAVCLVALALLGSFCDAQWHDNYKPSKPSVQEPKRVPQQQKQNFETPIDWTYPADPKPEPKPDVPFELRHPVPAATVAVECRENIAHVEVKKDMYGIGQFINPADLTLGPCAAVAEDNGAQVLIFESELHGCDSRLMMTEDSLIYTFFLNYDPQALGDSGVVRTSKAAIIVECHYPRKHNVSSLPLDPLWIPFSAVKVAEEFLYFTLRLMTDDWQYERPSFQYFLGDMIRIEALVKQYFHVPLRVYVDNCVANRLPDVNTNPRYAFIANHGCLIDGRVTGSDSKFMPRTEENRLQFQLEAFRFEGTDGDRSKAKSSVDDMIYITCLLKATTTSYAIDNEHRACSYSGGWGEASGVHPACSSCESGADQKQTSHHEGFGSSFAPSGTSHLSNRERKIRDVTAQEAFEWEGEVTLGPFSIAERVVA